MEDFSDLKKMSKKGLCLNVGENVKYEPYNEGMSMKSAEPMCFYQQ